jgi:hypothetical protein
MNNLKSHTRRKFFTLSLLTAVLLTALSVTPISSADEKMKPEDIIAKHLDSIGTAQARAAIKSRTIVGITKASIKGRSSGSAEGIVVLASEGEKNMIGMKFATSDYPFEKMGYDGKNLSVGFIRPGTRSVLGTFLRLNETVFRRGLLGGTLSTSWPLLNMSQNDAKMEYSGLKKVGDKKLHAIKYSPKKGADMSITLFFDTDTYQHVRTEYKRLITASIGRNVAGGPANGPAVDNSANQSETRYTLVEEFADFRKEGDLTLPHTYKIHLDINSSTGGSTVYDWLLTLQQFNFNQPVDPTSFDVDSY